MGRVLERDLGYLDPALKFSFMSGAMRGIRKSPRLRHAGYPKETIKDPDNLSASGASAIFVPKICLASAARIWSSSASPVLLASIFSIILVRCSTEDLIPLCHKDFLDSWEKNISLRLLDSWHSLDLIEKQMTLDWQGTA